MSRWFAAAYERVGARADAAGLAARRHALLAHARGRVLEVGGGTGLNLRHYPAAVERVDILEPDPAMRARLQPRLARCPVPATLHAEGVEGPYPDAPYDTIVCTLVLCTVPDLDRAVADLRDALDPDGALLYLEHIVSAGTMGRVQHLVDPLWTRVAGGCHLDRDVDVALRDAGLTSTDKEIFDFPGPSGPVRATVAGSARRRRSPMRQWDETGAVVPMDRS